MGCGSYSKQQKWFQLMYSFYHCRMFHTFSFTPQYVHFMGSVGACEARWEAPKKLSGGGLFALMLQRTSLFVGHNPHVATRAWNLTTRESCDRSRQ